MPANLTAEAQAAWDRYLKATTIEEKIKALEEFISLVPKHKGTEKLLKQAKQKLTKLRLELAKKREVKKGAGIHPAFSIPKEEDAQIVLFGTPGSGKTSLFAYFTGADVPIGKTTVLPNVGILKFSGASFQIVDLPPITSTDIDAIPNGRSILSIARNSDLIALVIDLSQDVEWQLTTLLTVLKNARIVVDRDPPPIKFQKLSSGGIQIYGAQYAPFSYSELIEIIKSTGAVNARLDIFGPIDEIDLYNALDRRTVFKKAIIVTTKGDLKGTLKAYRKIIDLNKILLNNKLRIIPTSSILKRGKEEFGEAVLKELNLIRIWLRKNGVIDERALVLRRGSTVKDAARRIHSDFVKKFRFAIVERPSDKVPKKRVGLDFRLEDNDVLTIYIRD